MIARREHREKRSRCCKLVVLRVAAAENLRLAYSNSYKREKRRIHWPKFAKEFAFARTVRISPVRARKQYSASEIQTPI
jgi:hypothetical protein